MTASAQTYPIEVKCKDGVASVRPIAAADQASVLAFARGFATHDLLFLRRDITRPEVVAQWVDDQAAGDLSTLVATRGDELLGVAVIICGEALWSPHVGELLVLIAPAARGIGLGCQLTQQAFKLALSLGIEKIIAQMTTDQRGALEVFENMSFRAEALLRDHVKDRDGTKHDLVILCHDVAKFEAQRAAYGVPEALEPS